MREWGSREINVLYGLQSYEKPYFMRCCAVETYDKQCAILERSLYCRNGVHIRYRISALENNIFHIYSYVVLCI